MQRMNFFLSDKQIAALRQQAKATGLRVSELVRQAIDDFLIRAKR
jgi:integrase